MEMGRLCRLLHHGIGMDRLSLSVPSRNAVHLISYAVIQNGQPLDTKTNNPSDHKRITPQLNIEPRGNSYL